MLVLRFQEMQGIGGEGPAGGRRAPRSPGLLGGGEPLLGGHQRGASAFHALPGRAGGIERRLALRHRRAQRRRHGRQVAARQADIARHHLADRGDQPPAGEDRPTIEDRAVLLLHVAEGR